MLKKPSYEELENRVRELEQATKAASTESEIMKALIDTAPAGVLVADLEGNIMLHNQAADDIVGGNITGDARRPASGYQLAYLDGTPYAEEALPLVRATLYNETIRDSELVIRRDDGTDIVALVNATPLRDENGQARGAIAIMLDITERKKAEKALQESERKFRIITDSVTDLIWQYDMAGNFTFFSPAWEKMTGYSVAEGLKMNIRDILPPDSFARAMSLIKQRLTTDADRMGKNYLPIYIELEHVRKDGSTFWVEITAKFLRDDKGNPVGITGVTRDISERKQIEAEREKLISELQKALDEIKTLRGIVPICGYCKKIRSDKGAWDILEAYLTEHTHAEFSHGICPDFLKIEMERLDNEVRC